MRAFFYLSGFLLILFLLPACGDSEGAEDTVVDGASTEAPDVEEDDDAGEDGAGEDDSGNDEADETEAPDEPESTPIPEDAFGTLALRFQLDWDWYDWMQEEPRGIFYGGIFAAGDVSGSGPDGDAEMLEELELEIDLVPPEGEDPEVWTTEVLYVTDLLPVGDVYILGFLDSDGNADPENTYPDSGDMATNPDLNNLHYVYRDVTTEVVVLLNLGLS